MTVTIKEPLDPHDVTDFRFQGLRKIRLSGNLSLTSPTMSLITTVPNTGMVLVVGDNCVHVVKTEDVEKQNECTKTERNIENCEINRVTINMPGEVLSVGVSCDGLTTSIVVNVGQFPTCLLYDTRGILTSPPDLPLSSTSLNTSSTMITGLYWNPALADMFCVTWEDGSLALYTVKTDGATDCLTLPPAGVVDMAWSPKGKQLVVLKSNRDLVQYKPDLSVAKYPNLKEMKTIPGPAHDSLVPVSISWLSTYEFLVGLRDGGESEGRPGLWLVKGSKEGHVEHTPYDDICYSTGEMDKMMYTTHTLSEWGVVVVGSSTSIELGVLGDGYAQWLLEDNARAEIPLSSNEECYPVGMAVDYTSAVGTSVGETTGPPSPLLYLLSSDGLLCPFYCVNHKQGAAPACRDRTVLAEGKRTGTVSLPLPHKKTSSVPPPDGAVLDTSTGSVQPQGKQSFGQPISSVTKPAANLSDIFALSGNSSFAQSTPMKPPPSSKPIAITDPSPALPTTSSFSAPKKEPTPPFRSMSKDPTPTLSKRSTPVSKDPSPTLDLIPAPTESTPITDTTSAKVSAAIDEEYAAFESELKELRGVLSGMKTFIGTQEDKVQLCTRTESCSKFCRDVIDTTKCQNTEIFSLRSSTLETFSWLEEAKARDSSTGDTRYLQLLRARPLDPRSLRKMEDLRAQFFYCEKQVEEAGNALDSQWEEHVGKLKRSIRSDQQSVREELSKAVMTNHKIIDRQRESVDEIKKKLLDLQDAYPITMGRPGRSPGKGKCETELDKLAESLREKSKLSPTKSVNNLRFSTPSPVKLSASAIVSPVKAFSPSIDQALRDKLDNRPLQITKAVNREKQLDRAEQPSSAKLLEKLKVTSLPTTQTKIVPSGSLSGLPSDKSAFQTIPTSHNSNKSSFQPVSVSKQSTAFTSGSISVVVTASSTPVKAPVYEPISPASNSPEKTEEIKEPSKAPFGLPVMTFGSSLVKTAASSVPSSEKAVSIDTKVGNMKPVESVSSKSLFASFGSGAALGNASSLVSSSSSTSSPSISTSVGSSKASSNTSSTDGIFSSSSSFSSFGSKLGNATEVSAAGDNKSVTSLVTSTTRSDIGFGSKTSLSFGGPIKSAASTLSSVASSVSAVTSSSAAAWPVFGGLSKTVTGGGGLTLGAPSGSIFGGSIQAVSTAVSVSGTLPGVTQSTPALIATPITSVLSSSGSSNTSIFGGTGSKSPPPVTTTGEAKSTGSLFGGAGQSISSAEKSSDSKSVLTTSSSASVFKATSQPTPSTGSVFGGTSQSLASTASAFGGASKPSILTGLSQPAASSGSVFGGTSQPASSTGSVFGGTSQPTSSTGSVFGGTSKPTSSGSVFGGTSQLTSSGSVFGGTSQPTSSTGSVFGGASQTATSTLSVFGATSSANTSVFGGASKISTSTGSVFGESSKSSDQTGGSVFGGAPKPAASAGSVFGGTTKATVASGSVFGGTSQPAAVTGSVFGGTSTASTGSVFGGSTNISAPAGPVFGGTSQSATTAGSVFGGTPQSTAPSIGSVFGGATQAEVTTESVFGGQTKSAVSTGTVFGGGSQPSANAGSVFGGSSTSGTAGSAFGGSSQPSPSVFGGTGGSVFGGTPNTAISSSVFGATTQTTTASLFGGSTSSVFGGSSTGGSGGFMGGLGGTGSMDNSNKNPFGGTTSTFGSSSTAGLFGSSGTQSVFGGTSQPSAFGSASSFSGGGGGNISSQGFGVQNTPTKPSGFGAAPAFGSPPALGSAPAFGSPAGFGGASTFGGGATFGSSGAASSAFGAATNAPTFGSMAASSAPAFGAVASSSPSFGSSGSAFGGGGGGTTSPPPSGQQFSSWR